MTVRLTGILIILWVAATALAADTRTDRKILERLSDLEPQELEQLLQTYESMESGRMASQIARELLSKDPKNRAATKFVAQLFIKAKNGKAAIRAAKRYRAIHPSTDADSLYAEALAADGQHAASVKLLDSIKSRRASKKEGFEYEGDSFDPIGRNPKSTPWRRNERNARSTRSNSTVGSNRRSRY